MTRAADVNTFESFQDRVVQATAVAGLAVVACAVAASGGYTPVTGGLAVGMAASLASHWIKVRTLRGIGRRGAATKPGLASLALLGRLGICGAALAAASATPHLDFWAAAAGLLLANAVTVVLAVRDARRTRTDT